MNNNHWYTVLITGLYSILVFLDTELKKEKTKLKEVKAWAGAITHGALDASFALVFFYAMTYFKTDLPIGLTIGGSTAAGIYLRTTVIETLKERIMKWKS